MSENANVTRAGFRTPEPMVLQGNLAENFKRFKRGFQTYMVATGNIRASEEEKVAMLLNLIGEETHEVYNTFDLPSAQQNSMEGVLQALEKYFLPKKNIVYERFVFYSRNMQIGETFDHFLTEIKKLSKACEFAENESMLRDRIVLGIIDEGLRERLLRVHDLTLEKAIEYCHASEQAQLQAKALQGERVNVIKAKQEETDKSKKKEMGERATSAARGDTKEYIIDNCRNCGRRHAVRECPAFGKRCLRCDKVGHFAVKCRAPRRVSKNDDKEHNKMAQIVAEDSEEEQFGIYTVIKKNVKKNSWFEMVKINGKCVNFKLDSGSDVNVMPHKLYRKLTEDKENEIQSSNIKLVAYGGAIMKPMGLTRMRCEVKGKKEEIEFVIVDTTDMPIMGRESCEELKLVKRLKAVTKKKTYDSREQFIQINKEIFEGLGCYPYKQKIRLKENVTPVIKPTYRVAESIKHKLKQTLKNYESKGIITRVHRPTDWVNNMVIVEKPNGTLRLCLDPKELNEALRREHYPIPTEYELAPRLANKKIYTVLDMTDGFFQLQLDHDSSMLCTFHTPEGRYRFNRMPFGLASAPEIFQRITTQVFGDIPGVTVYFDDLVIAANTVEEHDKILEEVVEKAKEYNLKFNKDKMQYRVNTVKYIGQIFSEKGIDPDPERVQAIKNLKNPSNVAQLQSIMGLVNYMGKFIPQLAKLSSPMRKLLKKDMPFNWTKEHSDAFEEIKTRIMKAPTLKCYNPKSELILQTDSSKDGMGACLLMDGLPIGFASRSLSDTEQRYAQIEKELLSICFACNKFHSYIYGQQVTVNTDHKPLETILKKDISKISARLQRMCLGLLKYNIDVKYIPGKNMYVADLLSRNYVKNKQEETMYKDKVHTVERMLPISEKKLQELQRHTRTDKTLSRIIQWNTQGWPSRIKNAPPETRWAWKIKNQIQYKQGLLMLDDKIIIPDGQKKVMLEILHKHHFGIVKTKKRARQLMYWRGMTEDIETMIKKCIVCEKFQRANQKEPLIPLPTPQYPFEFVGTDICTYAARDYLIVACYQSKWLDIHELKTKAANEVIKILKSIFATHGIPQVLVSDNVPFNSWEFKKFAEEWDFRQSFASPHYPRANGLAERMVGVAKAIIKKTMETRGDLQAALLDYRTCPLEGIPYSPAQIAMGRNLRTKIPCTNEVMVTKVNPKIEQQRQKERQQKYYNLHAKYRTPFKVGDSALMENREGWEPVIVKEACQHPRSYIVTNKKGKDYRRNTINLRRSYNAPPKIERIRDEDEEEGENKAVEQPQTQETQTQKGEYITRSGRTSKLPGRYKDFI